MNFSKDVVKWQEVEGIGKEGGEGGRERKGKRERERGKGKGRGRNRRS